MINALAHFFIPRQSNNHKAKLLHSSSLVLLLIAFISFQGIFQIIQHKNSNVLGYAANISVTEVQRLTNVERQNNGLPPLSDNPTLDEAALAKGKDMLAKGYWAHVAPDGTEPWLFFTNVHYGYRFAGENLARDFSNPQAAVNAWMASPSHRENILSSKYKEIGIGVVEGNLNGADTTIIVQFFGTKLEDAPKIEPVAAAKTPIPSIKPTPVNTSTPSILPTSSPAPAVAIAKAQVSPTPQALVAGSLVTPFDATKYMSLALVGVLVLVVAIDGIIINKRKIFRLSGHFPAHIAFLGMILAIVVIAKAGRII
jgi:hypothetical protein